MKKIEIRPDGSRRVYTEITGVSKTDQSQKEACDVNNIMSRYKKTGQITHLAKKQGVYADLTQISDLQSAIQQVQQAKTAFMTLPAELRAQLNNDPAKLVEFLQNPKNDELAIKYGLKDAPPPTIRETPKTQPKTTKPKPAKETNDDDLNDDDQN